MLSFCMTKQLIGLTVAITILSTTISDAFSFSIMEQIILSRRDVLQNVLLTTALSGLGGDKPISDHSIISLSSENQDAATNAEKPFTSAAFPKKELTNSIVASRDTNVSPLEVYETLSSKLRSRQPHGDNTRRALDVGAGAGVSTQVFYRDLGYTTIDAVDWSSDAWEENVVNQGYCPPSVNFFGLDDERFVLEWQRQKLPKYDIIAFNFAVNREKALYFCRNLLKEDGLLLAPINTQTDYWLKQTYQLLDSNGKVQWSANDVGAWSVQFQPDVTSDTCQGIWCSPYNGFQKLRTYSINKK